MPGIPAPTIDRVNFSAEAFADMQPSLTPSFSLANFLLELTEIKTLFKVFSRSKSLLSNVGSGHLAWSFGWKPFISDLDYLWKTLTQHEKILKDFLAKQGQPQYRRYKSSIISEDFENIYTSPANSDFIVEGTHRTELHASLRYTYVVPGVEEEWFKVKAILDMLGLNRPLSVVWEAIPFSFVVDWFFNVGDFIGQAGSDHVESKITVLDYCVSSKTDTEYSCYFHAHTHMGNSKTLIANGRDTLYERKRELPPSANFGLHYDNGYGAAQMLLSVSLLVS